MTTEPEIRRLIQDMAIEATKGRLCSVCGLLPGKSATICRCVHLMLCDACECELANAMLPRTAWLNRLHAGLATDAAVRADRANGDDGYIKCFDRELQCIFTVIADVRHMVSQLKTPTRRSNEDE